MKKPMFMFALVVSMFVWSSASAEQPSLSPFEQSSNWLLNAMKSWVPLSDHKIYNESEQETEARYDSIAHDALAVSFETGEKPLFDGPYGRQRTGLLMIAIARWESNYVKRIDNGECREGECDHGLAACIMQVHTTGGLVLEKDTYSYSTSKSKQWRDENEDKILTGKSLRDRKTCFRAALHKMRESLMACRNVPTPEDRLGIYTGEGCNKERPNPKSRTRIKTANWWTGKGLSPVTDLTILSALNVN